MYIFTFACIYVLGIESERRLLKTKARRPRFAFLPPLSGCAVWRLFPVHPSRDHQRWELCARARASLLASGAPDL